MSYSTPLPTPAPVPPGWTPRVVTPAGAPYPTVPYPTAPYPALPASPAPRAFDPNDPAAFATDLALQIDAAAQSLVDLIEVLARLADGPQLGDAVDAYVVSEELDGRNTTADADRLLLHAANAPDPADAGPRPASQRAAAWEADPVSKPPRPPRIS